MKKRMLIEVRNIAITALLISLYFMYLGPVLIEKNLIDSSLSTVMLNTLGAMIPIVFMIAVLRTWFITMWNSQYTFSFVGICLSFYHGIIASILLFMLGVCYVLSPAGVVTTFCVLLIIAYVKLIINRTPKKLAEDIRLFYQACVKGAKTFLPAFVIGCKDFYGVLKGRDMRPLVAFLLLTSLFIGTIIELLQWTLNSIFN